LDRVAKLNHEGANINAILELNPELELLAQAKDHEKKLAKQKVPTKFKQKTTMEQMMRERKAPPSQPKKEN